MEGCMGRGDIWIVFDLAAPSMSGEVDAALGKQEGSAVLISDFQVQVFTHLNPDHMLSHICISTAVSLLNWMWNWDITR